MNTSMDAAFWDGRYAGSDLVWSAEPNQFVAEFAANLPVGRALDLAGGEGRNALWLAERGWQSTLVDFSQVALDRAQQLAADRLGDRTDRLTVICADLTTYAPPAGSYDLVLVVYLHLTAPILAAVLQAAAAAVAPGGHLFVVGHHSDNLSEGVGGPQDPAILYSELDVAAAVEGSGLTPVRVERVLRPTSAEPGAPVAVDALYIGQRPA
jgi:SAM-dependent methyltransferase